MSDSEHYTPTDLGDFEIGGWNRWQHWTASIAVGFGFLGFCILVWQLTR